MNQFSSEEINLLCIYNAENRQGAIQALQNMKQLLEPDENEFKKSDREHDKKTNRNHGSAV